MEHAALFFCFVSIILAQEYLSFILRRFLNLSFSILSAISVSPSLHLPPHLHLLPYLHLPRHLHLPRYLYLPLLHIKQSQNGGEQFAAFCLFMGTSPKNCALLGRNGKTLILKTSEKLNNKQTSIATVRELYQIYATFLTLLVLKAQSSGKFRERHNCYSVFYWHAT